MKVERRHIIFVLMMLFVLPIQAATVTYHILTLPIPDPAVEGNYDYHMKADDVVGHRLEAVKVVVNNQSTVELPAHYKSPLATGFTYYAPDDITVGSTVKLYEKNNATKGTLYDVKGGATPIGEGTTIDKNTAEYYVVYTYNSGNTVAKLDGSQEYNINVRNKGFLALNRGRNNRPAVVPTAKVNPEMLASEDFVKIESPGAGITTYWSSGDNKNKKEEVESQFHFIFRLEGSDPYNIIIRSCYNRDYTYIEKNDDGDKKFVYKWYKGGQLFAAGNANAYIASDEHKRYQKEYNSALPNPTEMTVETDYILKDGQFHGQSSPIWSTYALLNNTANDGFVFMGTRTVDGNGAVPTPGTDNKYNYLKLDNNNLTINKLTAAEATKSYTIENFYALKKVTYKVPTSFYAVSATDAHIVSVSDFVSQYTVEHDPIDIKYIPQSIHRKYCSFNGIFYKDPARTIPITRFSDADYDNTEGYQIYLGYDVSPTVPFKAITPAAAYDATTWAKASWYELTDAASTQIDGMKLKYDGAKFNNDGADGAYDKTSEFAFIGDPYELLVVYRNATSGSTVNYVGASGTPPSSPTNLSLQTTASEGFIWQIQEDDTEGSFLLQKYKGEGHWYWEVTRPAPVAVAYATKAHTYNIATANAQAVTFNVSGLTNNEDYYITVTKGGTNADQVTIPTGKIYVEAGGTASFKAMIKGRGDSDKSFTLSVQQYTNGGATEGAASVITVHQDDASFSSNTVQYSTANATRVKVMNLPKFNYTYHIVDKSGRIAVKASVAQSIFSPLSLSSLPSMIISPFLVNETLTFYGGSYTDGAGRGSLTDEITETPNTAANIYVKYTTASLDTKPFKLSETQEIFVRLNGQYIYYEDGTIKTSDAVLNEDKYKWKLRNRDPYAMLIDNIGARTALSVAGQTETVTVYDDNSGSSSESREKGAWVKLAAAFGNDVGHVFDADRADAQPFIPKSSSQAGVYEVMVATGSDVDASTTYYNIGRPADNTVKIYDNTTYRAILDDELKFRLEENTDYIYHLIDKAGHELLTATSKSPELVLPAEYQSPLVGTENYSYYTRDNMTISDGTYTPTNPAAKLSTLSELDASYTATAGAYSSQWTSADATHRLEATDGNDMAKQAKKLTSNGDYYCKVGESTYYHIEVTKPFYHEIYVTYEANDLIGFNNTGRVNEHPYLLRFLDPLAEGYYLEDGNDKLTTTKIQAIYPYCNGDGNLNIYGEAMRDEQMGSGSSTRSRWVWFFESANHDPYHVRIRSRNTISYHSISNPTYLHTQAVHFEQDGDPATKHIVTGGALPGIASETPTEYMILGRQGAYQLVTTNPISDGSTNVRRTVTSFEQYWKTYNMIKLHVLGLSASTDAYSDDIATWVVPDDPSSYRTTLEAKQWHSYEVYASATRWNGYNDKENGHEKKVVEKSEHWFQTFDMGNGTFDIEDADIPPVLILLDRHGWEIMRRPLPANYPVGDEALAALREYDSPLVDRYYFYSNATKATGCHKYSIRLDDKGAERDRITVNGAHFSSTSLGDLPPVNAKGVMSSGVLNDQFVVYTVKEEYKYSYSYTFTDYGNGTYDESGTASKFLVIINNRFSRDNSGSGDRISYLTKPIHEGSTLPMGNVYDMIISPSQRTVTNVATNVDEDKNGIIDNKNLWYIRPNLNIDKEMGIKWAAVAGGTGQPWTEYETKKAYRDSTGFDPYNLQLQNAGNNKYLTTHMTSTRLENGIMVGDYSGGWEGVTMEDWVDVKNANTGVQKIIDGKVVDEGYDHTNLKVTNQTFMAVSDAHGNMQIMPRFDHTKRINVTRGSASITTLQNPVDQQHVTIEDTAILGPQTTFFVRPQRYIYHIMDNSMQEAMTFKRGGDYFPEVTEHFKSPLAKDFTFYKDDDCTQEITGSFAAADIAVAVDEDIHVYVRYRYDEDADKEADKILQGQWFTVKLANKQLQSVGTVTVEDNPATAGEDETGTGVTLYSGDKPAKITADQKEWQWKFLTAPMVDTLSNGDPNPLYRAPDPYSVKIYNRRANYAATLDEPNPMSIPIKVPNETNGADRFVILSHPNGGYALAVAKNYADGNYLFVNGENMTDLGEVSPVGATTASETDFTYKKDVLSTNVQIELEDDVEYHYTYKVVNNSLKLAVTAEQNNNDALMYEFTPNLPDSVQTPLLNMDDYLYYGSAFVSDDTYTVVDATKLYTLYGLYDDVVYVRYKAYDPDKTTFKVPNEKAIVDSHVARGATSHDVSMNINGELPYNIIWYNDNMMMTATEEGTTIRPDTDHPLDGNAKYVWYFKGNDPYALIIEHKQTGNYVNGTGTLVASESDAKSFMLLKKEGFDYGILQMTDDEAKRRKLTGYGNDLTANAEAAPTQYIIFGLSVHDLIYRLIIAKTGETVYIPYKESEGVALPDKSIVGTSQRDLTSVNEGDGTHIAGEKYQLGTTLSWGGRSHIYCHDAGTVSIGDDLWVPNEFYRPNCTFEFYVEGVYSQDGTTTETALDDRFKGLKLAKLMSASDLIDKTVVVNIVYSFDQNLATNTGLGFVMDTTQNLWYTFETLSGTTPYLAHYTNAWGLQSMPGRETRYTNDYLWTPLGDVYGFKMYNRYMLKNSGGVKNVMTMDEVSEGQRLVMTEPGGAYEAGNEIFELLTGDQEGYFRVHPVINKSGTQYYVRRDPSDGYTKLSTTPCDWYFGLDLTLLEPYYERAGYVGGLTDEGKEAYETAIASGRITDIQNVVYNDDNIVQYTPGYYRLHNQPGVSGIRSVRYASGYLHESEKTALTGKKPIPMHFYSRAGVATKFSGEEGLVSGFTTSVATRGDIPIDSTEMDPSTIFYFSGNATLNGNPRSTMQTQGLYVAANANGDAANGTTTSRQQRAVMSARQEDAVTFSIMDIGGAVVLMHDGAEPATRRYFNFDQTSADSIYDLKYYHNSPTDGSKWCMQPVQKTAIAGNGEMPLIIATNNGGDGYYYATFYAPFDVLLPADGGGNTYNAYTCRKWYDEGVNPVPVPAVGLYPEGKFVPAGTPVIIRTDDESDQMTLTLPSSAPSDPLSCVFMGSYLDSLLTVDADHDVYTFGLPMTSDVTKAGDYITSGDILAPLPEFDNTGVGFYINATRNKEKDPLEALWTRNNRYVLHNKIFYRGTDEPRPAQAKGNGVVYVPVLFENEQPEPDEPDNNDDKHNGDGCVYDLLGRKVADADQVQNGSCFLRLQPGIYILNGKKILNF